MQRCVDCQTPFTWKQINKSVWLAYKPITCPNCGMLHKVQFLSRILASIMMVGPLFVLNFIAPFAGTWSFIISVLLVLPAVYCCCRR
ncbi:TIGR04104 family putative zinc finger protein [Planococcus sp. SE5232]|uniref:TIGR04104 family putative zinc finger protein n=1 Tax=unclassified Planococcus (in: firmicutes) TaxID=2662419 RepID=UPI003D6BB950